MASDVPEAAAGGPADAEVEAVLRASPEDAWRDLADAVRDVEAETAHATWRGGEPVTSTVDGVPRTAVQMPYPVYSDAVERLRGALGRVGAVVVFAWPRWDGLARYRTAGDVVEAPAADAARLVTAILRSERFGDGAIEAAVTSGLLTGAARRLLAWHDGW